MRYRKGTRIQKMTTVTNSITIHSEDGEQGINNQLDILLVSSNPDCPFVFYVNSKPVFSLSDQELGDFIETLNQIKLNP